MKPADWILDWIAKNDPKAEKKRALFLAERDRKRAAKRKQKQR